jgi:PAS domain S-box-containing protein
MAVKEDLYRFILEEIPEAIIAAEEGGRIAFFNPAAERLLGYSASEVEGRDITVLVPIREDRRADPLKWLERWARDPEDNEPRFLDLIAEKKDGSDIPLSVRVRKSNIGDHAHFLITIRDVSAQRAREAEQRNASLRATRVLQIAEDAILSIDEAQDIIFANLKAEEMFGYSSTELLGQPVTLLLPEGARANHKAQVATFGRSKVPSKRMSGRGEIAGQRKSGDVFPMEASITNVTVGGASTYTAHLRDISTRKAAERALVESDLRARAIFDNAYQAMALMDPDGRIIEINKAAIALTTGGKVKGVPLWDLPWVFNTDETRAESQSQLKDAVDAGAKGQTTRFVGELTSSEGTSTQIDFNLIPIANDDGNVIFLLAEGRDITGA